MRRSTVWCLICAATFIAPSAQAQSFLDAGGSYAGAAGLGAGLSASMNHLYGKNGVTRGYQALVDVQRAALAQSKAIEEYMAAGCRFEAQKNWENAEKSFTYVLNVVARRDGPGSPKSVPALKHLVTVTAAQNKLNEAIGFQKTVLAFSQQAKDAKAVNSAQIDLAQLFIRKEDYVSAEPVCSQSVMTPDARIPSTQRRLALNTYAKVLRKLHKDDEAAAIEAKALDSAKQETAVAASVQTKTAGNKTVAGPNEFRTEPVMQKGMPAAPPTNDSAPPVTDGASVSATPASGPSPVANSRTSAENGMHTASAVPEVSENGVAEVEPPKDILDSNDSKTHGRQRAKTSLAKGTVPAKNSSTPEENQP